MEKFEKKVSARMNAKRGNESRDGETEEMRD